MPTALADGGAPTAPPEAAPPEAAPAVEPAPAKVNLCLHVTGRRADGYHVLDSLVAFAGIGDTVVARAAPDAARLSLDGGEMPVPPDGEFPAIPPGTGNLAWRALAAVAIALGGIGGVEIGLRKRLPAGAGLGGGSSDAAAVVRAVAALQGRPGLVPRNLVALGADVPMCLDPRPWRARGVGDLLDPVRLGCDLPVLLVWPARAVATPAVFAARAGAFGAAIPEASLAMLAHDPIAALAGLRNDLQDAACAVEPAVAAALRAVAALPRCRLARMSGSGSAVFGLFEHDGDATAAARRLAVERPGWWIRASRLLADRAGSAGGAPRLQPLAERD